MQRGTPKLFVVIENEDEEKSEANLDDFLLQPEAELSSNIVCAIVTADRELKIAMVDMLPYGQASPFAGLEPEIVKRFCTMYNCTYETCSDEFFWGDVYSNGTG
ncbi:unnamed protein product, partial [Nesidiocoris tenuis]